MRHLLLIFSLSIIITGCSPVYAQSPYIESFFDTNGCFIDEDFTSHWHTNCDFHPFTNLFYSPPVYDDWALYQEILSVTPGTYKPNFNHFAAATYITLRLHHCLVGQYYTFEYETDLSADDWQQVYSSYPVGKGDSPLEVLATNATIDVIFYVVGRPYQCYFRANGPEVVHGYSGIVSFTVGLGLASIFGKVLMK